MTKMDYLKLLVDEIHSTTVATIGSDGHPQTVGVLYLIGEFHVQRLIIDAK